jgi:site-specific recombinase XerC
MDRLLDTYIEHLENERNNSAKSLESMSRYLQRLRISAEMKMAQKYDLQASNVDRKTGLVVDLTVLDEMEDILN